MELTPSEGRSSDQRDPLSGSRQKRARRGLGLSRVEQLPLWMIALVAIGLLVACATSERYQDTLRFVWRGVLMTIRISLVAYAVSLVIGLIAGLGRRSKNRIAHTIASLYVELSRGVPALVLMAYVGFVIAPALSRGLGLGSIPEPSRAIIGLAFVLGAFLAEVFRAGIEAIGPGQMDAALSLGMSHLQAMRYIILPQAIRTILPPLGNEFIGAVKTSSLASILAVSELTHQGRVIGSRTFDTFTAWNTVAMLYLLMTLSLSFGVRLLERKKRKEYA